MRLETEVPLEVQGFNLLPNYEAKLLQETLGVEFVEVPYKVEFDLTAKLLHSKGKPWESRITSLIGDLFFRGIYDWENNIVFSSGDRRCDLHENAHAWIHQQNPETTTGTQLIMEAFEKREDGIPIIGIEDSDIEEAICLLCFREGTAEWMAQWIEHQISDEVLSVPEE